MAVMRPPRVAAWAAAGMSLLVIAVGPAFAGAPPRERDLAGFIDDRGEAVDGGILKAPLLLLAFGYTSCPDVCPMTLLGVHLALERLGAHAADVDAVFVTVDPDRDSLERLHTYVAAFDRRIRGLRADDPALRRLARSMKVQYGRETLDASATDYPVSHTSKLFLMDRDRRIVATIDGDTEPGQLAEAIGTAVTRAKPHAASCEPPRSATSPFQVRC